MGEISDYVQGNLHERLFATDAMSAVQAEFQRILDALDKRVTPADLGIKSGWLDDEDTRSLWSDALMHLREINE